MRRGRIVRMDDWDKPTPKPRLKGSETPLCDLRHKTVLHRIGNLHYFSQFRRTKSGTPFDEVKRSPDIARMFADAASAFIASFIADTSGWAIVTTPRRRHSSGWHFASEVCRMIADRLEIPFHADATLCVNRSRLDPDFYQLLPIEERKIIVYDDIITTGSTLTATRELFSDREMVVCIVGINNR